MTHYLMDCYATDAADDCESFPINAGADAQAIWEARSAAKWRKPAYFQVREVMRHGDRAVHDSRKDG